MSSSKEEQTIYKKASFSPSVSFFLPDDPPPTPNASSSDRLSASLLYTGGTVPSTTTAATAATTATVGTTGTAISHGSGGSASTGSHVRRTTLVRDRSTRSNDDTTATNITNAVTTTTTTTTTAAVQTNITPQRKPRYSSLTPNTHPFHNYPTSTPNNNNNDNNNMDMNMNNTTPSSSTTRQSTNNTSTYTPILQMNTPQETSLLLLPPSQSILESLTSLTNSTTTQLTNIWDVLGCSPEERADQLTQLLSNLKGVCQETVSQEQKVVKKYQQTITKYKEEIRSTCVALKIDINEELLGEQQQQVQQQGFGRISLQDEVMNLDVELENLRSVASVARVDLESCHLQLVEASTALGMDLEESFQDITSDLTQGTRDRFHAKVEEVQELVKTRTAAIIQLLQDCQELLKCLKYDMSTPHTLDYRIGNSLKVDEETGVTTLTSIVPTDTCTGIHSNTLNDLSNRLTELHGEKRRRKLKLADMGAIIGELWEKLHVPMEEQRSFADSISGLGLDTLEKGERELERLESLKQSMMADLIQEARTKIQELWKETNSSEEQQKVFEGMSVEQPDFDQELLTQHEEYIQTLETCLNQMRPILTIIAKRENVVKERMEYEEYQKDPDRLKQRGSALTKQLMKEEKMSKRIKKDLPKYTTHLEKKLQEWQNDHSEPFLFEGEPYLDVMKRQEEDWLEYKDEQMQMKLRKKQQEKAAVLSSTTTSIFPTKKTHSSSSLMSRKAMPLADGTNRPRAVSRMQNSDLRKNGSGGTDAGPVKRTNTANRNGKGMLSRAKSRPKSRPKSRVRSRMD